VIRNGLPWARNLLRRLRLIPQTDLAAEVQPLHPVPEQLGSKNLVVVRDDDQEKWVCFRCPGGCGEKIMLNLSASRLPRWKVEVDWLGRPTVSPSVRQVNACGCHFRIRKGSVYWCRDSGDRHPEGAAGAVGHELSR